MANVLTEILEKWSTDTRNVANQIIKKYGQPDEQCRTYLIWHHNGPWIRTVVRDEATEHLFPMPHTDIVEQFIRYRVPTDKLTELAEYDGSVTYKRTEGLLSARCHDEPANFLALNLAHDIIAGDKTVQEAKDAYVQALIDFREDKPVPYMDGLQFTPQVTEPDPGVEMISKEKLESYKE